MRRSAVLTIFVWYCAFSFSQQITFTRKFETIKKSVPLAIINSQPGFFYVLRYNKILHDLTIEKRSKPGGEIIGFTPLKLDSVNANWFNYGKLDYLFFEKNKRLYFLFEKVLNTKKTLYLKIIDTLTKSSGFMELASIGKDKSTLDFSFEFKNDDKKNILIISSQTYYNTTRKSALLFDTDQNRIRWEKKLPIENSYTGYSRAFECNDSNDLFYIMTKARVLSMQRKYMKGMQMDVPLFFYDTVTVISYLANPVSIFRKPILANLSMLSSIKISTTNESISINAHYTLLDTNSASGKIYFYSAKLNRDLSKEIYRATTLLRDDVEEQLTFYDGTDFKYAGNKEYSFFKQYFSKDASYQVAERKEENYYKELLVWKTDLASGQTTQQVIIPRKFVRDWARFRDVGGTVPVFSNNTLSFIILEAPSNFKKSAREYNYQKFKGVSNLWRANLVLYKINNLGELEKNLLYHNADFDMVPLEYSGDAKDVVFYLTSGKYEKFAILNL